MKYKRQGQILKIIANNQIKTHEQLIYELEKSGYKVTQATVSRDIKELGLVKNPCESGGSVYGIPKDGQRAPDNRINIFSDAIKGIDCALHTVVIKTYPGMAPAVAASVDSVMHSEFLGSIAGDDTLLIIARDAEKSEEITRKLRKIFSAEGDKNA